MDIPKNKHNLSVIKDQINRLARNSTISAVSLYNSIFGLNGCLDAVRDTVIGCVVEECLWWYECIVEGYEGYVDGCGCSESTGGCTGRDENDEEGGSTGRNENSIDRNDSNNDNDSIGSIGRDSIGRDNNNDNNDDIEGSINNEDNNHINNNNNDNDDGDKTSSPNTNDVDTTYDDEHACAMQLLPPGQYIATCSLPHHALADIIHRYAHYFDTFNAFITNLADLCFLLNTECWDVHEMGMATWHMHVLNRLVHFGHAVCAAVHLSPYSNDHIDTLVRVLHAFMRIKLDHSTYYTLTYERTLFMRINVLYARITLTHDYAHEVHRILTHEIESRPSYMLPVSFPAHNQALINHFILPYSSFIVVHCIRNINDYRVIYELNDERTNALFERGMAVYLRSVRIDALCINELFERMISFFGDRKGVQTVVERYRAVLMAMHDNVERVVRWIDGLVDGRTDQDVILDGTVSNDELGLVVEDVDERIVAEGGDERNDSNSSIDSINNNNFNKDGINNNNFNNGMNDREFNNDGINNSNINVNCINNNSSIDGINNNSNVNIDSINNNSNVNINATCINNQNVLSTAKPFHPIIPQPLLNMLPYTNTDIFINQYEKKMMTRLLSHVVHVSREREVLEQLKPYFVPNLFRKCEHMLSDVIRSCGLMEDYERVNGYVMGGNACKRLYVGMYGDTGDNIMHEQNKVENKVEHRNANKVENKNANKVENKVMHEQNKNANSTIINLTSNNFSSNNIINPTSNTITLKQPIHHRILTSHMWPLTPRCLKYPPLKELSSFKTFYNSTHSTHKLIYDYELSTMDVRIGTVILRINLVMFDVLRKGQGRVTDLINTMGDTECVWDNVNRMAEQGVIVLDGDVYVVSEWLSAQRDNNGDMRVNRNNTCINEQGCINANDNELSYRFVHAAGAYELTKDLTADLKCSKPRSKPFKQSTSNDSIVLSRICRLMKRRKEMSGAELGSIIGEGVEEGLKVAVEKGIVVCDDGRYVYVP